MDRRVKLKECEKWDKYLEVVLELKMWKIKLARIPIEIVSFGIILKGLVQGLEDLEITEQVEPIQTTALLRLSRMQETWGDLL